MTTLKHDEMGVEVVLPEITGLLWTQYWAARIEHAAPQHDGMYNPGELLEEKLAGLLVIADVAVYRVDGEARKLDMNAPLRVIKWVTQAVDEHLAELSTVPKN